VDQLKGATMKTHTGYEFTAIKGVRVCTEQGFITQMSAINAAQEYIKLNWVIDFVIHTNTRVLVKKFN
jgi:hypothetical protein